MHSGTLAAATMVTLLLSTTGLLANDIVITGGRVIDPETGLDAIRNVAIEGDKIVAISEFPLEGDVVIDATGHAVSPGFIDLQSHGNNIDVYRMQVIQGVTTALELQSGLVPIGDWYDGQAKKNLPMNYGASAGWIHSRIATFSDTDPFATAAFFTDAQAKGINVTTEAYPYGAASTVVGAAMFSGPDWRSKMVSTANNFQLGADRMTEDELADYQANKPGTFIVWHFLDEEDPAALSLLDVSVTNPATAIASDSVFWSYFDENGNILQYEGDEWPLPDNVFSHPRSTGTYTKILRSYVRERGVLSLSEAIRKMSLLPAQTLEHSVPQMSTKGRLQVGMDADIVVFDPATVADLATFENANQLTVGVQTVIVSGGFSVRDGELVLDAPNGMAIRNAVVN